MAGDGLIRTSSEKASLQNADWHPDDDAAARIVRAQYSASPYEQTPASPAPAPDANGRWRASPFLDGSKDGFRKGTPDGGTVTWNPDRGNIQPGAQTGAQPGADGGNGFIAPARTDGGADPNRNGDTPTGPKWVQPGTEQPNGVQRVAAKPNPVSPDDFWKSEDKVVTATAIQVGHRTNSPTMIAVAGGVMGMGGEWGSRFISAYADKVLEGEQSAAAAMQAQGRERVPPSYKQQWARSWQQEYDAHTKVRLQFQSENRALNEQLVDAQEKQRKLQGLSDDLGSTMAAKQPPSEKIESWLAEHNAALAKEGKPAVTMADADKALAKSLKDASVDVVGLGDSKAMAQLKSSRAFDKVEQAYNNVGGRGFVRGAAAVTAGLVLSDTLDRFTGNDQHAGLNTIMGAASIPIAAGLRPSQWLKMEKGGKGLDVFSIAAAGGALYFVGAGLDKILPQGTKDALASPTFNTNYADIGFMGLTAGLNSSTLKARSGLALSGWLEGRALGTDNLMWKAVDTVGALALTAATVPKSAWVPVGILHGLAIGANVVNTLADAAGSDFRIGGVTTVQHPEHFQEWAQDGFKALKDDMSSKSGSSLNDAIDKWNNFARRDQVDHDGALFKLWDDWTVQNKSFPAADQGGELMRYRGGAILSTSLGETRLDNGTGRKLDHFHMSYIPGLAGMDLDLGADAATYLETAKRNADAAIAETKRLAQVQGKTVDQSEIDGLNQVKQRDDKALDRIFNKEHDVATAMETLKNYWLNNPTEAQQNVDYMNGRIQKFIEKPNFTQDAVAQRLVAKMVQDKAMLLMACASNMLDHSGQPAAAGIIMGQNGEKSVLELLKYAHDNLKNDKDNARLVEAYKQLWTRAGGQQADVDAQTTTDVWNTGENHRQW